eukprot:NODE_836_length_3597_cov_0.599771.p2 type:complete len:333 gc:universal NODE_836_length_3597_cov_0.599771:2846-1848(-)
MLISLLHAASIDCPNVIQFAQNLNLNSVNSSLWTQLNSDCCLTNGIVCLSNRITQIDWGNYKLNGSLAGNLTSLSFLTNLDLSSNWIDGSISVLLPNTIKVIQLNYNYLNESIENWTIPSKLQNLFLIGNSISGPLPSVIPNTLVKLSASQNRLTGGIPNMPFTLQNLYLGGNLLFGSITNLPPLLKQLSLSNNLFTGDLQMMPNSITTFYLAQNSFTGIFAAFKPQVLFINNNKFTGLNITDYSALTQCSIDRNPLADAPNLPSPTICIQNNIYSLVSSTEDSSAFSTTMGINSGWNTLQITSTNSTTEQFDLPLVSSNFANVSSFSSNLN